MASPTAVSRAKRSRAHLLRSRDSDGSDDAASFYRHEGEECVQHLFRVAAASTRWSWAKRRCSARPSRLMRQARNFGGAGPVSAPAVSARVSGRETGADAYRHHARRGFSRFGRGRAGGQDFRRSEQRKVLVLGAGETSETDGARACLARRARPARHEPLRRDRAEALAAAVGGRAVPFTGWETQCREVDILISSTAAEEPLLTREKLAPILHVRWDRPLFIIDIAVPRDVAPDVNEMDGVFLYDIDSLQSSRSNRSRNAASKSQRVKKSSPSTWRISASGFVAELAVRAAPTRSHTSRSRASES